MLISLNIETSDFQYVFLNREPGRDLAVEEALSKRGQRRYFSHEGQGNADFGNEPIVDCSEAKVRDQISILSICEEPGVQIFRGEPEFHFVPFFQGLPQGAPFQASRMLLQDRRDWLKRARLR